MCLIISGDKKIPLNVNFIADVAKRNDDGYGMMWVANGMVHTEKSFEKDPQKILDAINAIYEYNPFIHFRMRTHGKVNIDNCHPYSCGHDIFLMHNGVLSHGNKADEDYSDTWHFIQDVIKPLFDSLKDPSEFLRTPAFNLLCKHYVGYNNRLVFLDKDGPALINHDTWVKVTNPWTGVKGLYVSNSYAWNESSFRDPNYQPIQRSRGTNGRWTKETGRTKGTKATTTDSSPCVQMYVSDRFKDKFDEYQHPFYLDDNWDVWEAKGRGFKRRQDLHWEDLSIIPLKGEPTSLREMVDETVVVTTPKDIIVHDHTPTKLEIPALVCAPPNLTEEQANLILQGDKSEQEEAQAVKQNTTVTSSTTTTETATPTITAEMYQQLLLNTYAKFSSWDLERRIQEDPEEAIGVFHSLLRSIQS